MNASLINKVNFEKSTISTDFESILRITWSPDSQYFAILQSTGTTASVVVYLSKNHSIIKELSIKKSGYYSGNQDLVHQGSVSFSPDGKYLAGGVGIITLWSTENWQPQKDILGPFSRGDVAGAARDIEFSPDSQAITIFYDSVLWPESITIKDQEEAKLLAQERKNDKSIKNSAAIMSFDVNTTRRLFLIKQEQTDSHSVIFTGNIIYSPNGKYILSSQDEKILDKNLAASDDPSKHFVDLKFRDPSTGNMIKEIKNIHSMGATAIAFSHDSQLIATGTSTTNKETVINSLSNKWYSLVNTDPIRLWNSETGEKIKDFGPLRGAVKSLAFTPDNKILISCQTDINKKETIWLWDISSGQLIDRIKTSESGTDFHSCAVSPNGKTILMPIKNKIYLVNIN